MAERRLIRNKLELNLKWRHVNIFSCDFYIYSTYATSVYYHLILIALDLSYF